MKEFIAGIVYADGSFQVIAHIFAADYTIVNEAILAMEKVPVYIIVKEVSSG